MCDAADVLLVYLPPYSPDFNPIETSFAQLKRWIQKNYRLSSEYSEEDGGFGEFLNDAVESQSCWGYPIGLFKLCHITEIEEVEEHSA